MYLESDWKPTIYIAVLGVSLVLNIFRIIIIIIVL